MNKCPKCPVVNYGTGHTKPFIYALKWESVLMSGVRLNNSNKKKYKIEIYNKIIFLNIYRTLPDNRTLSCFLLHNYRLFKNKNWRKDRTLFSKYRTYVRFIIINQDNNHVLF